MNSKEKEAFEKTYDYENDELDIDTKVNSSNEGNPSLERPKWFLLAYIMVVITIIGILFIVLGTVLLILKFIRFTNGWTKRNQDNHGVYLGSGIPKLSGFIIFGIGLLLSILGYIFHRVSLKGIDRYIQGIQIALSNQRLPNKYVDEEMVTDKFLD